MKKNMISVILALGILASAVPAAFAAEDEALLTPPDEIAVIAPIMNPQYLSVTARVLETGEYIHAQTQDAEKEEDGLYDFIINEDTLIYDTNGNALTASDIEKDAIIHAFSNADKPMVLVYPTRIAPEVVIVEKEAEEGTLPAAVLVDTFDKFEDTDELVSKGNFLRFNVREDLDIVDQQGNKFEGDLEGRDLIVFYTIATMSIPALTNPEKVIVLDQKQTEDAPEAVEITKVSVNGKEAVELKLSSEAKGMLPVRQIAELMGLEVGWDNVVNAVSVGTIPMGVNFNVGVNSYNKARMTPFVLSAAPMQVIEGDFAVTYVPQDFFTEVLNAEITTEGDTLIINADY